MFPKSRPLAALLTALSVMCAAQSPIYAEPGLPGRIFRRAPQTRPSTPSPAPEKLDVPKAFSPPEVLENVTRDGTGGAEVDVAEVLRRGDHVTRAGRGPMANPDQVIGDALSPPEDDSHKWFISIVVAPGERESDTLLYDLKHSPDLRAWAMPDNAKESWSHVKIYVKGDESQEWRWKNLRITKYPCMILQPPAKLASERDSKSWEWGDPSTVVWQFDGYDATLPDRAAQRSQAIRRALVAYVQKHRERQSKVAAGGDRPTAGFKQAAPRPSDDTSSPPIPRTVTAPDTNPFADPTRPVSGLTPAPGNVGGASLILTGLSLLAGGSGTTNLLLLVIGALSAIRTWKTVRGKAKLLDDASFAALIDGLRTIAGPRST